MNKKIIQSTCFERKDIYKGTWKTPGGGINQIDHILVSSRHASCITDVKTRRGPNCDSDHVLVKAKLRHRLSDTLKNKGSIKRKLGY